MSVAYKIREFRKKAGLTQAELAIIAGVSRTIISGLESGTTTVTSTATLLKLAKALNVTIDELFFKEVV
ncbi:helix-turn-helix domain-containing protein [Enterococcus casseliflavus]|jgi:Predicted transcriptional regulators|uniref:XRE family transcriptional regulator n=1 Tax=Enterococcus casseliflavus TaxID=37734 RepID=A0A415ENY3_ENTCA|nr:helix-turn-helix transcriptional regulator [Enterococcus casseliflavus]MBV6372459.1 helix-turn-helix transcriptional regulator [Enterococcus casseliflavus]MBX9115949.1 helix-turn-helix transcriptional regulator [Enterococcus casseliflavus]MBX9126321.1 helix-turn-helix transcriptional regulator [Enterococcus casseliflavus]RHK04300.1 XRE family transcriptional regulator [Enterococcus casseliflavus]